MELLLKIQNKIALHFRLVAKLFLGLVALSILLDFFFVWLMQQASLGRDDSYVVLSKHYVGQLNEILLYFKILYLLIFFMLDAKPKLYLTGLLHILILIALAMSYPTLVDFLKYPPYPILNIGFFLNYFFHVFLFCLSGGLGIVFTKAVRLAVEKEEAEKTLTEPSEKE